MSGRYSKTSSWFNCSRCPVAAGFKTTTIRVNRNGVIEDILIKQPTTPYWVKQSEYIRSSTYFTAGQSLRYSNKQLNEFGYWAGAPTGSGCPPKNYF